MVDCQFSSPDGRIFDLSSFYNRTIVATGVENSFNVSLCGNLPSICHDTLTGVPMPPGSVFSLIQDGAPGTCWDVLAHWSDRKSPTFEANGITLHYSHAFDAHLGCVDENVTVSIHVACDPAAHEPKASGEHSEGCHWQFDVETSTVCEPHVDAQGDEEQRSTIEANEVPIVSTECGPVRGTSSAGIDSFLSIPYAQPPVGELRWQPPARLLAGSSCWNGTLDGTKYAPACLQKAAYGKATPSAEDCLKLHVWAPASAASTASSRAASNLPVMVWLHGGGLLEGSSFSIQSGFEAVGVLPLALHAVVVGVEYRLGVAGFLALDTLAERDVRGRGYVGNYGLLDTLAALEWVQRNIRAFGGDPRRVTVAGQSSGGSLVFALLASPRSHGLLHAAISLSGSPRLNSTTREASEYWHLRVVERTRCDRAAPPPTLAHCLLSLNASELLDATPPDWHADVFGLGVFDSDFQYAPLLLLDGPGGVLPSPYVDRDGAAPPHMDPAVPLAVGATAQEGDFSPTDDVRNMSRDAFRGYLRTRLESLLGAPLVDRILELYVPEDEGATTKGTVPTQTAQAAEAALAAFEAQRVYSELVADAVVVCPNLLLASNWQASRRASEAHSTTSSAPSASSAAAPVYAYRASQTLTQPFCVLRNSWSPPYCPLYSFHASDMFAWLHPRQTAAFDYAFSPTDEAYGALIARQFGAIVNGTAPNGWASCRGGGPPLRDALPEDFFSAELRLPAAPVVATDKARACELWLSAGFYERVGLIN